MVLGYDLTTNKVTVQPFTGNATQYWRRADPLSPPGIADKPNQPPREVDLPDSVPNIATAPEYLGCMYRPVARR